MATIVQTTDDYAASAFEIEELSGDHRMLRLVGRALPYRPFELPTSMRATITYYPGNPIGTAQVHGADPTSTTIQGAWKDRFLMPYADGSVNVGVAYLDNVPLPDVYTLASTVENMVLVAQLMEVRWDRQVRRGLLRKFTPKWNNPHDVEWEMQFDWTSDGQAEAPPTFVEVDHQAIADDLAAAAADVQQAAASVGVGLQFFAAINAATKAVNDVASDAADVVGSVVATALSPVDASRRMLGVAQAAVDGANNLMLQTQEQVARSIYGIQAAQVGLAQSLNAFAYLYRLRSAARATRSVALAHRERLRGSTGPRSATTSYRVKQGEDLRTVAKNVYGRPEDWRRIALFNNLSGTSVAAGTVLAIPPATADASRSGVA